MNAKRSRNDSRGTSARPDPVAGPVRFAVPADAGTQFLAPREILCVHRERWDTYVITASQRFRLCRSLDMLEDVLAPHGFVRVHRAWLVNLAHIARLVAWSQNRSPVFLRTEQEIPVSKHRVGALRRATIRL